jgi:hypothetical protein
MSIFVVKTYKTDMKERRSDQVWLAIKREVKTRDDVVNIAQDDQACLGEGTQGAQGAQVT